jgi:uncharacterized protein (TIGR02453 family)
MSSVVIDKESIDFLKKLSKNNNRDWFNKHKARYIEAHANIVEFAGALLYEMTKHDKIATLSGKESMQRIYKDVRFSKVKTPYNTHWSGVFKRATKKLRGGYFFRLEPGRSVLVGGFWGPDLADLKRIRQDIDLNATRWKKMLANKTLVKTFGEMFGEQVASSPRGYPRDHPAIGLLRYKQFLLKYEFTDEEVCSARFVFKANAVFQKLRPFFDFMSEVLTTDANGESII